MPDRISNRRVDVDHATSTSICKAIGERLTQHLGPESPLPSRLQQLIDELHRQESSPAKQF